VKAPPTFLGTLAQTGTVAIIISFLFAVISIDMNREQEAFNRGAIEVTLGAAVVHIIICALLMRRQAQGRIVALVAHFGLMVLIVAGLTTYFIAASLLNGRVM
jgi:hypothetical protein